MTRQEFEAMLEHPDQVGAWTFLRVPFSVEKVFGSKARVAVKGTINGVPFRSSLMPQGYGIHFLVVNKALQKGASAGHGNTVHVVIETDNVPRSVQVPQDLQEALDRNAIARASFEKMPYSHKKEYVEWIESAKREETRTGRIERALAMMADGKRLKG